MLAAFAASAADDRSLAPDALAAVVLQRLGTEPHTTCVMAGVVREKTRVIFACNRDAGPAELDRDSIFELGSLSKIFAGVLLADMVRRGEAALADEAAKHAPPGARVPSRDGRAITLRHLVTHTAALPPMPPGIEPGEFLERSMRGDGAALYEALGRVELERPIGGEPFYSSLGFLWLSDLMARRAGMPYDRLLAARVLEPLGMKDTAVTLTAAQAKRRVAGHDVSYQPVPPLEFPPSLAGAAGLSASMEDLLKLAEALAGRRATPLAESIALSMTPVHVVNAKASMGYAWFLAHRPGGRVAFHNGQTAGAYAAIAVNPGAKYAAVVVADTPANFDDLAFHLADPSSPLRAPRPRPAPAAPTAPSKP